MSTLTAGWTLSWTKLTSLWLRVRTLFYEWGGVCVMIVGWLCCLCFRCLIGGADPISDAAHLSRPGPNESPLAPFVAPYSCVYCLTDQEFGFVLVWCIQPRQSYHSICFWVSFLYSIKISHSLPSLCVVSLLLVKYFEPGCDKLALQRLSGSSL